MTHPTAEHTTATELAAGYVKLTVKYDEARNQVKQDFNVIEAQAKATGLAAGTHLKTGIATQAPIAAESFRQSFADSMRKGLLDVGDGAADTFRGRFVARLANTIAPDVNKLMEQVGRQTVEGLSSSVDHLREMHIRLATGINQASYAYQDLQRSGRATHSELEAASNRLITFQRMQKDNTTLLAAESLRLQRLKREEGAATAEAAEKGESAFKRMHGTLAEATEGTERLGVAGSETAGKLSGIVGAMGGLATNPYVLATAAVVGLGAAAGEALHKLFELGEGFEDMGHKLEIQTGATGERLEYLKGQVKSAMGEVPLSMGQLSGIVAAVNTSFQDTGAGAEHVTKVVGDLESMVGKVDLTTLGRGFRAFGVGGDAEKQVDVLNQLFAASQKTQIPIDTLISTFARAAPVAQQFGFTIGQTVALMAKFDEAGVDPTKTMFTLAAAAKEAQKAHQDFGTILGDTITKIRNAGTEQEKLDIAMSVFGKTSGRGGAAMIVEAVQNGLDLTPQLLDQLSHVDTTVEQARKDTMDWRLEWQLVKGQIGAALEPVATQFFKYIEKALEGIGAYVEAHKSGIVTIAHALTTGFETAMHGIGIAVHFVGVELGKLWDYLGPSIVKLGPPLENLGKAIMHNLVDEFKLAWPVIKPVVELIGGALLVALKAIITALPPVINALTWVINTCRTVAEAVLHIGGVFHTVFDVAKDIIAPVIEAVEGIWHAGEKVADFFDAHVLPIIKTVFDIWVDLMRPVVKGFEDLIGLAVKLIGFLGEKLAPAFHLAFDAAKAIIDPVVNAFKELQTIIEKLVHWIGEELTGAFHKVSGMVGPVLDSVNSGLSAVRSLIEQVPGLGPGGAPSGGVGGHGGGAAHGSGFNWDAVAADESSGNWGNRDTGHNGHFGGLQFSPATWTAYGGNAFAANPADATREQQMTVADRCAFYGWQGTAPQGLGAWETIAKQTPAIKAAGITLSSRPPMPVSGQTGMALAGFGGGDIVPALLEPGEHVWEKEAVRGAGGHNVMAWLRVLARQGLLGQMLGFDDGGEVDRVRQTIAEKRGEYTGSTLSGINTGAQGLEAGAGLLGEAEGLLGGIAAVTGRTGALGTKVLGPIALPYDAIVGTNWLLNVSQGTNFSPSERLKQWWYHFATAPGEYAKHGHTHGPWDSPFPPGYKGTTSQALHIPGTNTSVGDIAKSMWGGIKGLLWPASGFQHGGEVHLAGHEAKHVSWVMERAKDVKLPKVAFQEGGEVPTIALLQAESGRTPYVLGGFSPKGIDCSGLVSEAVNTFLGLPPLESRTATGGEGAWLEAKGFVRGIGPPGTFQVGFYNGGPAGGHTALTLPSGINAESGGSGGGVRLGGGAAGANSPQFTDHYYLPARVAAAVSGGTYSPSAFGGGSGGAGGLFGGAEGGGGGGATPAQMEASNQRVTEAEGRLRVIDDQIAEAQQRLDEERAKAPGKGPKGEEAHQRAIANAEQALRNKQAERDRISGDVDAARNERDAMTGDVSDPHQLVEAKDRLARATQRLHDAEAKLQADQADPKKKPSEIEADRNAITKATEEQTKAQEHLQEVESRPPKEHRERKEKGDKDIKDAFSSLADIATKGVTESLMPPGFSNPFEWGGVKSAAALMQFIGGVAGKSSPGAGAVFKVVGDVMGGKGGAVATDMMNLMRPGAFNLTTGSPGEVPGPGLFNEGGAGGSGGSLPMVNLPGLQQFMAPGQPGAPEGGDIMHGGNVYNVDNSQHYGENGVIGDDPKRVAEQGNRQGQANIRQTIGMKRTVEG